MGCKTGWIWLCLSLWFSTLSAEEGQTVADLNFITESYPPYSFEEDGVLRGIAVDLLVAATAHDPVPVRRKDIRLMPWARSYTLALQGPNISLFATTRTPEREKLFKWAGPICKNRVALFAKKSSKIVISIPQDINRYTVGVIRHDVAELMMLRLGGDGIRVVRSSRGEALVKLLERDRIQLLAYGKPVARWYIHNAGLDNANFEVVYELDEADLYYAFSRDVDDALVEKLQKAIDRIKSLPGVFGKTLYDDILLDYL